MDPNDKRRIQGNLTSLIEDVRVKDVMPFLLQDDVCTFQNYEEIEAEKTSQDKALKLMEILQMKGPAAYPALCRALNSTGSKHLVDQMNSFVITENGNVTGEMRFLNG